MVSAAMVLAIAGSYFAWNAFRYEGTNDAQVHGHVMPLSARINGQIKRVYLSEGQFVHAGDVRFTAASSHRNASADAEVSRRELQLAQAELTSATP